MASGREAVFMEAEPVSGPSEEEEETHCRLEEKLQKLGIPVVTRNHGSILVELRSPHPPTP